MDETIHCALCNQNGHHSHDHPNLSEEEFTERVHELLGEEAPNEPGWYYMSFAEVDGFLGGLYIKAKGMMHAVLISRQLGLNPGGEVLSWGPLDDEHMSKVPEDMRGRLLTKEEVLSI